MDSVCDVIVVGAGPAGTTAARLCAQAGLDTVILDRAAFPREKPCAGGLSPRAVADLARVFGLEGEVDRAVLGVPRFGLRAHYHRASRGPGRWAVRPSWADYRRLAVVGPQPLLYVTRRAALDAFLLERVRQAGARALTRTEAVAFGQDDDGVWVTVRDPAGRRSPRRPVPVWTIGGRFLVGADGAASLVARAVRAREARPAGGRRPAPAHGGHGAPLARCLSLFVPLEPAEADRLTGGNLDLHFGLARGGYGWVFPAAGGVAAGVGALDAVGPGAGSALREALGRLLALYGLTPDRGEGPPRGWFVPLGGCRRLWESGRVFLVGDAAGVANPLTGEGIGPAVRSAVLAASAVIHRMTADACPPAAFGNKARDPAARAGGAGPSAAVAPAAAVGLVPVFRGHREAGYGRSLWRAEVSGQRPGLWLARGASWLPPERQVYLFRRAVFARLMEMMATR